MRLVYIVTIVLLKMRVFLFWIQTWIFVNVWNDESTVIH